MVSELSRLTRSLPDLLALLALCQQTQTLLVVAGALQDPRRLAAVLKEKEQATHGGSKKRPGENRRNGPQRPGRQERPRINAPVGYRPSREGLLVKSPTISAARRTIKQIFRRSLAGWSPKEIAEDLAARGSARAASRRSGDGKA